MQEKLYVNNSAIQEFLKPMNTLRLETLLNLSKTKVLEKLAHKYDPWQLWALLYIMNKWE